MLTPIEIQKEWERIKRDHRDEYEMLMGRKKEIEQEEKSKLKIEWVNPNGKLEYSRHQDV